MISEEEKKERNRICALRYYHAHKKLKREPKPTPETVEEYIERKRAYFREYYQRKKTENKKLEISGIEKME